MPLAIQLARRADSHPYTETRCVLIEVPIDGTIIKLTSSSLHHIIIQGHYVCVERSTCSSSTVGTRAPHIVVVHVTGSI